MKVLSIAMQARIPVLIWGDPGTGKTSYIYSLGKSLNLPVEVEIGSVREPSDFGYPVIKDGAIEKVAPSWAKRLVNQGKGILFLDELSTSPPAVQAAMLRVILERVVGDTQLPETIAIVAAANPTESAASGWDLTPPMANRFCHLDWSLNPSEWTKGFISGWPVPEIHKLPENWSQGIPLAKAKVAGFILKMPHLLSLIPKNEAQKGKAWPSPRTWDMAATLLAAAESVNDAEASFQLVTGCVGEAASLQFFTYIKDMDLINPEDVLANPTGFTLPERSDILYSSLMAVVTAVASKPTKQRWIDAWVILSRVAESGGKDVVVPPARVLITDDEFIKKGFLKKPFPPQVDEFLSEIYKFIKKTTK